MYALNIGNKAGLALLIQAKLATILAYKVTDLLCILHH